MNNQRLHYMDALRATVMLSGIILHSAIPFTRFDFIPWPMHSNSSFMIFDYVFTFVHTIRLPIFFFISGFFAKQIYIKSGTGGFLKNRCKRIAVPLLICLIVLIPMHIMEVISSGNMQLSLENLKYFDSTSLFVV